MTQARDLADIGAIGVGFQLISSGGAGSAISNLTIDLSSNTDFAIQRLVINELYHSESSLLNATFFEGGSEVTASSSYLWTVTSAGSSGNPGKSQNDADVKMQMVQRNIGVGSDEPSNLDMFIYTPAESGTETGYTLFINGWEAAGSGNEIQHCQGKRLAPAVAEKIKVTPASGTISYFSYQLYGYKK
jgi:hypothetical protein